MIMTSYFVQRPQAIFFHDKSSQRKEIYGGEVTDVVVKVLNAYVYIKISQLSFIIYPLIYSVIVKTYFRNIYNNNNN